MRITYPAEQELWQALAELEAEAAALDAQLANIRKPSRMTRSWLERQTTDTLILLRRKYEIESAWGDRRAGHRVVNITQVISTRR